MVIEDSISHRQEEENEIDIWIFSHYIEAVQAIYSGSYSTEKQNSDTVSSVMCSILRLCSLKYVTSEIRLFCPQQWYCIRKSKNWDQNQFEVLVCMNRDCQHLSTFPQECFRQEHTFIFTFIRVPSDSTFSAYYPSPNS